MPGNRASGPRSALSTQAWPGSQQVSSPGDRTPLLCDIWVAALFSTAGVEPGGGDATTAQNLGRGEGSPKPPSAPRSHPPARMAGRGWRSSAKAQCHAPSLPGAAGLPRGLCFFKGLDGAGLGTRAGLRPSRPAGWAWPPANTQAHHQVSERPWLSSKQGDHLCKPGLRSDPTFMDTVQCPVLPLVSLCVFHVTKCYCKHRKTIKNWYFWGIAFAQPKESPVQSGEGLPGCSQHHQLPSPLAHLAHYPPRPPLPPPTFGSLFWRKEIREVPAQVRARQCLGASTRAPLPVPLWSCALAEEQGQLVLPSWTPRLWAYPGKATAA